MHRTAIGDFGQRGMPGGELAAGEFQTQAAQVIADGAIVEAAEGLGHVHRVVERRNLPRPVQPGVTYRDVFVAVEILGHLNARCLLAGLLGADSAAGPGAATGACPGAATPRPVVAPNDR